MSFPPNAGSGSWAEVSDIVPAKSTMNGAVGTSDKYARADHVHPSVTPFNALTCSQDIERRFFKDDFSNNTIGQYTVTGSPVITGGALELDYGEKIVKTLAASCNQGKWEAVLRFNTPVDATYYQYFYLLLGNTTGTSHAKIRRSPNGDTHIYLLINGVSVILKTAVADLLDATWCHLCIIYNGVTWTVYYNGAIVGSATPGSATTSPTIGCYSVSDGVISNSISVKELTYSPSIAFTDPFTSDTESRYMQLSSADITQPSPTGTWAAAIAGDVVVSGGKMTLASTASTYQEALCSVLRSYNFGSGEYEFAFDNNNDGGGGADSCGLVFGYQDILNHYKLVLVDDAAGAETLKLYKVVAGTATQLGSTVDVSSSYTRGNKTWLKLHWDAVKGRMWVYLRDDAGTYPTTPNISDAFSAQFSYGKTGFWAAVTTAGESNLNVDFYPITIRALSLIGETNVPATEEGFYFRDEFSVDSVGRNNISYHTGLTRSVTSNYLSCLNPTMTNSYYGAEYFNTAKYSQLIFEAEVYLSDVSNDSNRVILSIGSGKTSANRIASGYTLEIKASNSLLIRKSNASAIYTTLATATKTISAGVWYPVKFTWDMSTGILQGYFDGESTPSVSVTDTTYSTPLTPGVTFSPTALNTECRIRNVTISGTRVYNKPMLRGCQIGEYWNGTASVPCTRFVDDFNWDTIGEWTQLFGAWTLNTTKNELLSNTGSSVLKLNAAGFSTGIFETVIIFPSGTVSLYTGIVFGWDGAITGSVPSNGYIFQLRNDTGTFRVTRYDSGSGTNLVSTIIGAPSYNVPYLFRVNRVVGNTVCQIINMSTGAVFASYTMTDTTHAFTSVGLYGNNICPFKSISINAIESTAGNNPICIGGVPHGARYDVQEYAVRSFTNAVRYGEYRLASAIKTTNASAEDIELYLKNATDSSNITDDASDTVAVALADTNWANITKAAYLNADDVSDTITIQARRKTAATDNAPACLVDFVELLPICEVG